MIVLALILVPFTGALAAFLPLKNAGRCLLFLAVTLVHAGLVASCWKQLPPPQFDGALVLDPLGLIMLSIDTVLFLSLAVYMIGYFEHEQRNNRYFMACLLFVLSAMSVVAVSYHMGLLWVSVETTTLLSAPLISFHRTPQSLEATWKYLLICSVGIALALMGTFFLAIAAHDVHTLLLPSLLNGAPLLLVNWLKLSVIFLFVGYGCKMGLAPTHSWKPEAYGQATGMVVVVMAGALTQCAFLALLRVSQICHRTGLGEFYGSILILSGFLSLVVPALFVLGERNIKRAFAYSSIEHMGLLVLGLGLGGAGVFGALFHMINNALAKVIMFFTAGSIAQKYGSSRVGDVRGILHVYPVTGMFLIVAFLAGTGMFPFATFHSELMILNAAIASRQYVLAAAVVACLALVFVGIGRIILDAAHGEATAPVLEKKENLFMNTAIGLGAAGLVVLGVWLPVPLERVIRAAAALVGG